MEKEFTQRLEEVLNTLFKKNQLPSITSDSERVRVIKEIDNFQGICKSYSFSSETPLLPFKALDEYNIEDLRRGFCKLRDIANDLMKSGQTSKADDAEISVFIDFINDTFDISDMFVVYN